MNEPTLRIDDLDNELRTVSSDTCTLSEFLADNVDMDPETLDDVRALPVGECLIMGGGAAPLVRISAIA